MSESLPRNQVSIFIDEQCTLGFRLLNNSRQGLVNLLNLILVQDLLFA
jgi:hypothetical protein